MASQVVCGLVFRLLLPVCLAAGKLKGLRNADFIACRVLLKIAAALTINKKKRLNIYVYQNVFGLFIWN